MYSDEKPRIREYKEMKTEEEHGIIHHKIPDPKAGTKSINLDIQNKHDGGRHRNAKIFLLSLVVILTGLVGLIIMENRGLSDQIDSSSVVVQSLNTSDIVTELNQVKEPQPNNFISSLQRYKLLYLKYPNSPEAIYGKILYLSFKAAITGSTDIIKSVLTICLQYLEFDELISDNDFKAVSYYCIARAKLINLPYQAIRIYLKLIKRFEDDPQHRNELAETFFDMDRFADATFILEENLKRFPNNGTSSTLYGHICYIYYKLEKAAHYLRIGIESGNNFDNNGDIYTMLGETLLLLNRTHEAREIYKRGVTKKLFASEYQRPGTYIEELKAQPIWTKEETPYIGLLKLLESNWKQIRDEGLSALNTEGVYLHQNETLTIFGHWKQFYLLSNGNRVLENCKRAQFTCALIQKFFLNHICYSGQVKFSVIYPGTKVKPHCGPHNARLRVHLGLKIPKGTKIRVVEDVRFWEEGKVLIIDDSFEHEIWHNGSGIRLILIVDLWHPQATDELKEFIKDQTI